MKMKIAKIAEFYLLSCQKDIECSALKISFSSKKTAAIR